MQKSALFLILIVVILPILLVGPSAVAASQTQIILSCSTPPPGSHVPNGCISSELVGTPPITSGSTLYIIGGFWVWCQSTTGGGNSYGPDCAGSIYVEEVNLVTGAGVYDATAIRGTSDTTTAPFQVTFTSTDGDMSCTLSVTPGSSTLSGTCDKVPITFSDAIVRVT
ncbi:MAG: hypothetical protein JRN68_04625 [Nitrososphaerota archaeon]|jgi:hypothetical protein|nr:hypothetical protein [Nitrososphaerota archaeon]